MYVYKYYCIFINVKLFMQPVSILDFSIPFILDFSIPFMISALLYNTVSDALCIPRLRVVWCRLLLLMLLE